MTNREILLKRIAAYDFAIVELHLFLDTHPNDRTISLKINEYIEKSNELRREFEREYGPLMAMDEDANSWAWISNPWPWDTIREGDK